MVNKLLGLLIVALIARELGVDEFASYALAMVVFGYFVEISYYSLQNKHLFSYGEQKEVYLHSQLYASRFAITAFFSFFSFFALNLVGYFFLSTNIFPLTLVLIISVLNIDYLFYVNRKSNYLVLARFTSQMIFLSLLYLGRGWINSSNIMYFQLINSLCLFSVVLFMGFTLKFISFSHFFNALLRGISKINCAAKELTNQFSNFYLKILTLSIITVEMPLFILTQQRVVDDLAVSYRLALIVLPFVVFYLNTNSNKLSQEDLVKKVFISSLFSCALIFMSTFTLYVVFGREYIERSQIYGLFFSVIPFQTLLNYMFYLASKDNSERAVIKIMSIYIIFYCLLLLFLSSNVVINPDMLAFIICVKYFLVILSFKSFSLKTKFVCLSLISLTQILSFLVIKAGFLKYWNFRLIDEYDYLIKIASPS